MTQLNKYRVQLTDELARLDADLAASADGAQTVTLDQTSVGRLSRMDALQQQAMARGLQGRLRVRRERIVAALERLDTGKFGLCCECGTGIEPDRLNVDATSLFCVECAETR